MSSSVGGWVVGIIFGIVVFLFVANGGINYVSDIADNIFDSNSKFQQSNTGSTYEKKATAIANAIEPRNSAVRTYALKSIKKSSSGEYNIGQICDIYDNLISDWVYVNDPSGSDYYASASESVSTLRGDCDDYAILMVSLVESIGGVARVICAYDGNGGGHAYAEVYMTNSKSQVQKLVNNICNRYRCSTIHYHTDSKGRYWLNLDWSATHPGGTFYNAVGTGLMVKSNGYHETIRFT